MKTRLSPFLSLAFLTLTLFHWSGTATAAPRFLNARFGAPIIVGHANVAYPNYGDIVLDQNDYSFWGYSYNGSSAQWVPLTAPAKAPTVTVLTSTICSSTGYITPPGVLYVRVRLVGGGGGGWGNGTSPQDGSNTTWGGNSGTPSLTAYGGKAPTGQFTTGGAGGASFTLPSGAFGISVAGGSGGAIGFGVGGSSPLGGGGASGVYSNSGSGGTGGNGAAGTGGGGGGGGSLAGGGSGGYVEAIIVAPTAAQSCSIGSGGAGASGNGGYNVGGAGGSGSIQVTEYYY